MTLINPILSEWKYVGLELTIPMTYHLKCFLTLILTGEVISAVVKRYFFSGLITGKGIVISCFVTKSEKYKLFFSDFQNVEIIGC